MYGWRVLLLGLVLTSIVSLEAHAGAPAYRSAPSSNLVSTIQAGLHMEGYDPGEVDGQWGARTRRAWREFQRAEEIPVTSEPDRRTVDHLLAKNKSTVRRLQEFLESRDHYEGEVDGSFGPVTRAALKRYEEASGLPVTGELRGRTREEFLQETSAADAAPISQRD